jgi:hypothetical protein
MAKGGGQREKPLDDFYAVQMNVAVDVVAQFRFEGPLGNNSCFLTREGQGMLQYVTDRSP